MLKEDSDLLNVFDTQIAKSIIKQKGTNMDNKIFKVTKIEGDYAYLTPTDGGEEIFIALALLPLGIDIGTLLVCEGLSFENYA